MARKGNEDPWRARFLGYDAAARAFLLAIEREDHRSAPSPARRDIGDLQALDRAIAHSSSANIPRLSLRRLKKLAEASWQRGDTTAGWRRELQKNVAACEQWLATALTAADESVRQRFVDADAYAAHHRARAETQARTQRAKQLQQYFTSATLVQEVMARLVTVLDDRLGQRLDDPSVLWLEPACGDGRLVDALVAADAKRVVAYELDERVCARAQDKRLSGVSILQGDFLASTPPPEAASKAVMALGNPPFGDVMVTAERDLVAKFVLHTVRVWHAQLVAFIVPSRCGKPEYLDALLGTLNEGREHEVMMWSVIAAKVLEDCIFDFQEAKRVKQPSALVVLALQDASRSRTTETVTSRRAASPRSGSPERLGTVSAASDAAQC